MIKTINPNDIKASNLLFIEMIVSAMFAISILSSEYLLWKVPSIVGLAFGCGVNLAIAYFVGRGLSGMKYLLLFLTVLNLAGLLWVIFGSFKETTGIDLGLVGILGGLQQVGFKIASLILLFRNPSTLATRSVT